MLIKTYSYSQIADFITIINFMVIICIDVLIKYGIIVYTELLLGIYSY